MSETGAARLHRCGLKPRRPSVFSAVPSRRGDLQILGFCLLHWLCGSLPWDGVLKQPTQVQEAKASLMDNLPDSVLQLSVGRASTDEVASFLLYVKTLDYQDKPDYRLLKELLSCGDGGRLDFSVPEGAAGSAAKDPPNRAKGQKAGAARGAAGAKLRPAQVGDEDSDRGKNKPVQARYIRGPPVSKPPAQQTDGGAQQSSRSEDENLPAVRRSLRLRPARTYEEDDREEEEEEEVGPKPVPARYLRGPPIGQGAPPKQKTRPKRTGKTSEEQTVTCRIPEPRLDLCRRTRAWAQSDRQTHTPYTERPDDRPPDHGRLGDGFGGSDPRDLKQKAVSTQSRSQRSWFVYVGVFLLLVAVFEFAKVFLHPFKRKR